MKKLNNKGFSMVELIIVIAIMAILVGAIAPTLIKYIKKSRRSADLNNGQTIAAAFQEAAANPDAADGLADGTYAVGAIIGGTASGLSATFQTEFKSILGTQPKPKLPSGSGNDFYVTYTSANNSVVVFAGTSSSTGDTVYPTPAGLYSSN